MNTKKTADSINSSNGRKSGLLCLNASQFFGALNDNLFKFMSVFYLIGFYGAHKSSLLLAVTGAIFVLPFLLFNAAAGVVADRTSKRTVLVASKWAEVLIMLAGLAGFWLQMPWILFVTLFLMAAQSAFFGPAKYGIIPELTDHTKLAKANGMITMLTYIAIIGGSALAPALGLLSNKNYLVAQCFCVVIALTGAFSAHGISRTSAACSAIKPSARFVSDIWRTLVSIRKDGYLILAVLGSAYFSMLGAYLQLNVIPYGMERLGLSQETSGYLFFFGVMGIAAGAWLAGHFSGRNIELGIVPIGALLLAGCIFLLSVLPANFMAIATALSITGFGAGLFIVPVDAFIQERAPGKMLGRILAASSFLGWLGVLLASGFVALRHLLGFSAAQGLIFAGILTLVLGGVSLITLPDFLLRFLATAITRLIYRIDVKNPERVPSHGPALLVSNHVSYLDALLLSATQQRRIRFIMGREAYEKFWFLRPCFRLMGAILISPDDPPKRIAAAFKEAREALNEGRLVCIFAEGALTRTGFLGEFRRGIEHISKNGTHPVIPVLLGGVYGTFLTYFQGRLVRKPSFGKRHHVTVKFGHPMEATTSAFELRSAIQIMEAEHAIEKSASLPTLAESFIVAARKNWNKPAIADALGSEFSYAQTACATFIAANRLRSKLPENDRVGILLPTSTGGAIANLAVLLLNKTAINFNYTVAPDALKSAIKQSGVSVILTSPAWLKRLNISELPIQIQAVEALLENPTFVEKTRAFFLARLLPSKLVLGKNRATSQSTATIIFSSGSTSEPKGIMLTHANIASNLEALKKVLVIQNEDSLCGILPFFHSLGYTGGLWMPLLNGLKTVYHPNPLDSKHIAKAVGKSKLTLIFATPTLLSLYLRRIEKGDFSSLRLVIAGAESLNPDLADAFEEKFGVRPFEGYGATELSPVATLGVPTVNVGNLEEIGWAPKSSGRPLPGVAVRVVDPEDGHALEPGCTGMLLVKGPNLMAGYLDKPELDAEAIRDGWYCTGDLAQIDAAGFVFIQDRLARFSKIGGEMVSHRRVEDEFRRLLGTPDLPLAVTGIPDQARGERLVVLYTEAAGQPEKLCSLLASSSLPNLWKPDAKDFIFIPELPLLGTGKLDLRSLKCLAKEKLQHKAA